MERGLLVGRSVAGAIGLAVTVELDASVGLIDDRQVDEFTGLRGLGRTVHVLRAQAIVAPGHPLALLSLGEDERVEGSAADGLHRDDAAAALVEGGQCDPGFEGLGRQGLSGRAGLGEGILTVEDEPPVLDERATVEFGVELADEVTAILFEGPPMAGGRAGCFVRLQATTEDIGGKFAFDLGELLLKADTVLGGGADALERGREVLGLADPVGGEFRADGLLELGEPVAVLVE